MTFFPAKAVLQSIKQTLPFKPHLDFKQWFASPKLILSMLFNAKPCSLITRLTPMLQLNELSVGEKFPSRQYTSIPFKNFSRNIHFTAVSSYCCTINGSNLLKESQAAFRSTSDFQLHNVLGMFSIRNKKVRDYFPHPNELKRIKKHGWKKRMSTRAGRLIIMSRILKMRHYLTH